MAGGAVFGFASGFAISFGSLFLGALSSYALGRFLARDFVVQKLGSRTEPIERLLKHHAFWAVVRLRILPAPFCADQLRRFARRHGLRRLRGGHHPRPATCHAGTELHCFGPGRRSREPH